jgi:hypothetical protein
VRAKKLASAICDNACMSMAGESRRIIVAAISSTRPQVPEPEPPRKLEPTAKT